MEYLQIKKDFVLAAHAAACPSWKDKIEREFPALIQQSIRNKIENMDSYKLFYSCSYGDPVSIDENKDIHVMITVTTRNCMIAAFDFVKDFVMQNQNYTIHMEPTKIVLKKR